MSHPPEPDPHGPSVRPPEAGDPAAPAHTLEKSPTGPGATSPPEPAAARRPDPGPSLHPAPRFWSVRRLPAALTAIVLLCVLGALLYDVASVRADRPSAGWRDTLAEELATRPLDDPRVGAVATLFLLLGICLVVLAVTPGLRGLLPMRRDSSDLRPGMERRVASVVLRDRAMEVSGVRTARVSVGRSRVRVVVLAHFRDLDEVRRDLDAVLEHAVAELGLAKRPGLSVYVRRPAK